MKKSIIATLFLLIIASPLINAVTFEKISGKRTFYMPELTASMGETTYEVHSYEIDFPGDEYNSLQSAILKEVFGDKINPNASFYSISENFLNTPLDEESNERPQLTSNVPDENNWIQEMTVSGKVISQNSKLIVYEASKFTYMAAATHGLESVSYLNYYIPTNKRLTLFDVLLKSKKSTILKSLRKQAKIVARNSQCFSSPNDIPLSDTFYISSKGITFVYQPYEIACYADGIIEITIPKSQLAGCLTTLGKKLIK